MRWAIAGLLIAVVVAASAMGATSTRKRGPSTRPTTRAVAKSLHGEIVSVNIETKVITVKVTNRQHETSEVNVTTDEKTQFTLEGSPVTLVDLKPQMPVVVQPDTGTASRVIARTAPPVRKPKNDDTKGKPKGR